MLISVNGILGFRRLKLCFLQRNREGIPMTESDGSIGMPECFVGTTLICLALNCPHDSALALDKTTVTVLITAELLHCGMHTCSLINPSLLRSLVSPLPNRTRFIPIKDCWIYKRGVNFCVSIFVSFLRTWEKRLMSSLNVDIKVQLSLFNHILF
jgi:hypothetical protein